MFQGTDFSSDTVTRPTLGMRKAMAEAEVGDEQKGEDPTTRRLEDKVAEILGHSASLFLPSATMANEIAIRLHCEPGDELIAADSCHLFFAEAGGPAVHSGVMCRPIVTTSGIFTAEEVRNQYRWNIGSHYPRTRLVSVENTTNMGGGCTWPAQTLQDVLGICKNLDLKTHLDGARLFNAVIATNTPPQAIATNFDTVTLCLSKGLGCPAGALLAFDKEDFDKVRRLKQLMGGALRQSGILAAAGLYALEHHVQRLEEDHKNATRLAQGLSQANTSIKVDNLIPDSNMVYFQWSHEKKTSDAFSAACLDRGVRFSQVGPNRFRAVLHLDVNRDDVDSALNIVKEICHDIG